MKLQEYKIADMVTGSKMVRGHVRGQWAACREGHKYWRVTHLPSGLSCAALEGLASDAIRFLEWLDEAAPCLGAKCRFSSRGWGVRPSLRSRQDLWDIIYSAPPLVGGFLVRYGQRPSKANE